MSHPLLDPAKMPHDGCLTLIGMAGAGKSTIGALLSKTLDWPQLDTDQLIESFYGAPLQTVFDALGLTEFRRTEDKIVAGLTAKRCVISTGGSVVYGANAMDNLHDHGPVIFLDAGLETIRKRIGPLDSRGLAIAPGQSFADLFQERRPLYRAQADFILNTDSLDSVQCADAVMAWLAE